MADARPRWQWCVSVAWNTCVSFSSSFERRASIRRDAKPVIFEDSRIISLLNSGGGLKWRRDINDYQRGRRIGWFQRTFRVFSVDHSSTILVYVYIYIERIYTIAMYIIGSTTKNVDLVSGFSCKSRQGRSTFVCVRVPGARLLTTFSFDLRHALHLWQRGNVFRVFQETSRYPHASNTRLEECPSPSTISNVLFGRMVERDGFLNAWNRSS